MSFMNTIYNNVFRRTSTFALACVVGAFGFERGFDLMSKTIYENINRGKLWKDICYKYAEGGEEE